MGASGALWGPLGAEGSTCPFGSLVWAPSWSRFGGLLGRIGGLLGRLGALLGRLGALLGASWAVLERSWGHLGGLLAVLGRRKPEQARTSKPLNTSMVLALSLFRLPDAPRQPKRPPRSLQDSPRGSTRALRRPGRAPGLPKRPPQRPKTIPRRPQERVQREGPTRHFELSALRGPPGSPGSPREAFQQTMACIQETCDPQSPLKTPQETSQRRLQNAPIRKNR